MSKKPIAVITGASSGIGAASAAALAAAGFSLILGARRQERLADIAAPLQARALPLDVTDPASVAAFCDEIPGVDLLVNNAGAALGLDRIGETREELWRQMYELNVLGVVRMTKTLLPKLALSLRAHIVVVGSTSGFEVYPGGAGYTASKHALRALVKTLRLELLGQPIRVTDISPGLVETEFATVRHAGNAERAKAVYQGMTPLRAEDVAAAVAWAATRPSHVNVDEIVLRPVDQASSTQVFRRPQ
jgi:NADP-dependent 3-hydroxy acid dehydrogenase YdfG